MPRTWPGARPNTASGSTAPVSVDMKKVKARKDHVLGLSTRGVERWLKEQRNITVYQGHAPLHVRRARSRSAGDARRAAHLHQRRRPRLRAGHTRASTRSSYLTNSSLMDVDFLPPHLIIVGGSYIGLEFGKIFRRFGSEVTVIEMAPRLIPREDEDVSAAVAEILKGEGIDLAWACTACASRKRGADIAASLDSAAGD